MKYPYDSFDNSECQLCGKNLYRPYGKKRTNPVFVGLDVRMGGGSKEMHHFLRDNSRRIIYIGLCCLSKLEKRGETNEA